MENVPSFNQLIQESIINNWDLDALTDYKGATLQFHDVARKIERLPSADATAASGLWPSWLR